MSDIPLDDIASVVDNSDDSNDSDAKLFGDIISNSSSRKIYLYLFEHEESPANIKKALNIDLSLVSKYLGIMDSIKIVSKRKSRTARNKEIYIYKAKMIIILAPKSAIEKIKKSKNILRELKKSLMLLSIPTIAAFVTGGILTKSFLIQDSENHEYGRPTEPSAIPFEIIITVSVIIICSVAGFFIIRKLRNKK